MPSIAATIEAGCQVLPPRCRAWRSGTTVVPVRVEIAEASTDEAPILAVIETFHVSDGSGRESTTYRAWQGRFFVEVDLVDEHHTNRPPVTVAQYLGAEIRYANRQTYSLQEEQAHAAVAQQAAEIGRRYLMIDGVLHRERAEPVIRFEGRQWTVTSQCHSEAQDVYRLDEEAVLRARTSRFSTAIGATIDLRRPDLLRRESHHARSVRLHLEAAVKESHDTDVTSFRTALDRLIAHHDPAVLPAEISVARLRALAGELRWFCDLSLPTQGASAA